MRNCVTRGKPVLREYGIGVAEYCEEEGRGGRVGDVLGWWALGVCGRMGGVGGKKSTCTHAEAPDWDQTKWRQPGSFFSPGADCRH